MVTADDVYAALVAAHHDLTPADSAVLDARLILLLSDALNDPKTVMSLIARARAATR